MKTAAGSGGGRSVRHLEPVGLVGFGWLLLAFGGFLAGLPSEISVCWDVDKKIKTLMTKRHRSCDAEGEHLGAEIWLPPGFTMEPLLSAGHWLAAFFTEKKILHYAQTRIL